MYIDVEFKDYEELTIEQKVLMGNHNATNVRGKGVVKIKLSSRKRIYSLTNVLNVPDIKKNLVSANLLCKRRNFKNQTGLAGSTF